MTIKPRNSNLILLDLDVKWFKLNPISHNFLNWYMWKKWRHNKFHQRFSLQKRNHLAFLREFMKLPLEFLKLSGKKLLSTIQKKTRSSLKNLDAKWFMNALTSRSTTFLSSCSGSSCRSRFVLRIPSFIKYLL